MLHGLTNCAICAVPPLPPLLGAGETLCEARSVTPDASSLLPPLVAIALAIWTRQVHLSLAAGIVLGATLLAGGDPGEGLANAIEIVVQTLSDSGNAKVVLFSCLVGSVIALSRHTGGDKGFVLLMTDSGWVNSARRAQLMSWCLGVAIFIESSLTSLINGSVCRPLFDRFGISRAKLAWLCDATSAPVCVLLPLNGWVAYVLALLKRQGVEEPISLFARSVPLNFYALIVLFGSLGLILLDLDFGPMKRAGNAGGEKPQNEQEEILPGPARDFLLPLATLVVVMPLGLWITGKGDLLAGSGSTSVLWAVLAACAVAAMILRLRGRAKLEKIMRITFDGAGELISLSLLLMLAFAIGHITRELGTGVYLAQAVDSWLPMSLVPVAIFLVAGLAAFSTGTSWGTFALLIPLALPMVQQAPELMPLALAAVLGGGVFGDHCSPISDTTLIASLASECDHIEHVTTQLPYALVAAGLATGMLFLSASLILAG